MAWMNLRFVIRTGMNWGSVVRRRYETSADKPFTAIARENARSALTELQGMTARYTVHVALLGLIYLVFAGLTVLNIRASSSSEHGAPLLNSIVKEIFPASIAIPALLLIIGIGHAACRRRLKPMAAWAVIAAGAIPGLLVFDNYAVECDVSREIRRQIHLKLSAREAASLSTRERTCPTFFSYRRESDHKPQIVTGAADMIHGIQVSFGAQ